MREDRWVQAVAWAFYAIPFLVWMGDKLAPYEAKTSGVHLTGWSALMYDWQQGWSGGVAAVVAGAAAYLTIRATREAAKEQVHAADRQVATAKEVAQMQVAAANATLEQERTQARHAELLAVDRNLSMQMEMVRAWREAFSDLRSANEDLISRGFSGFVVNFELPITLNLTTDQCNLLGVSDAGLVALGDLIAASMRCRFAIQEMQRNGRSSKVLSLHRMVPGILDRIEHAHSVRRAEVRAILNNLASGN